MTAAGLVTSAERAVLDLIGIDEIQDGLAVELLRAVGKNPPSGEGPTTRVLERACRDRGLEVTTTMVEADRQNLSAVLPGDSGPGLLLLGHTDVVPVGDGWTVDRHAGLRDPGGAPAGHGQQPGGPGRGRT
ncbi:MAG TPA: hypothetical protein VGD71_21415 [Kribbella sp.]